MIHAITRQRLTTLKEIFMPGAGLQNYADGRETEDNPCIFHPELLPDV